MRHVFNVRNFCVNCKKEIDYRAIRCRLCSSKDEKRSQRISKALQGKLIPLEIRKKISKSHKKNIQHIEFLVKMNKARKGKPLSKKHRIKISEANKGKKISEEHRQILIQSNKEHIPWNKGKHLSKEHKKKIGEKSKGRKFSPRSKESRQRTSDALKNPSKQTRERFARSKRGHKNPNWQGGISFEPYSPEFNDQLKYEIRKRDNFICQFPNCGIKENGRKHSTHHIDYDKKNNESENLITICIIHHATTNNKNRKHWTQLFQEIRRTNNNILIGGEYD